MINRRELLRAAGYALGGLWTYRSLGGEDARALPDSIRIDALSFVANPDRDPIPLKVAEVRRMQQTGIHAVNWTVSATDFERTVKAIAYAHALAESDPARWLLVQRQADLAQAKREGRIGVILGFQFPEPLGADTERIEIFHRLGVRIVQLTYNNRGLYGDGCLEPGNAGLSKLGHAAVARMNELGVAVDVSHCGKKTTAEAIAASKKPILITHSGCSAVYRHPRSKDDDELRALANRGGVIGIYFMPYLVPSPKPPTKEDVLAHLDYALKVCGSDHVGIGSDQPLAGVEETPELMKEVEESIASRQRRGVGAPGEDRPPWVHDLNSPRKMEILAAGMRQRGHSAQVVEKVLGKNFYRALGEIWGA